MRSTDHDPSHAVPSDAPRPAVTQLCLFDDAGTAGVVGCAPLASTLKAPADLSEYEEFILFFSGGKDSVACALHLLELGVPAHLIEIHHHPVDGREGSDLMDWPCTDAYCEAFAKHFGFRYARSWKVGGFEGELLRENARTAQVATPGPDGQTALSGGTGGSLNTRRRFPQVSPDLRVRWCSSSCKIEVGQRYFTNHPRFADGRKRLVITGERAEESATRARYATFERHRADRRRGRFVNRWLDHWRPVHAWLEREVWAILERHGVVPHPAYWIGLGRASCQFCIFGGPDQWATMRFISPLRYDRIRSTEREFGVTIHRSLTVDEQADRGQILPGAHTEWRESALSPTWERPIVTSHWALPPGAFARACSGPS